MLNHIAKRMDSGSLPVANVFLAAPFAIIRGGYIFTKFLTLFGPI